MSRANCVEVLNLEGLELMQKIETSTTVLDVLCLEGVLYVSLDVKEGNWIEEFRYQDGQWTRNQSERWRITEMEETKVELYYLEMNRKKTGSNEDD